jgi:SAM-dependent methyltransferase
MSKALQGYVSDVAYSRQFHAYLAPAWLDFVATLNGFDAPLSQEGFTWCDLGCGAGVTATYLAAAHPTGRFYGIDALPEHIVAGNRLKAAAKASNVTLIAKTFGEATAMRLPRFDYIVAHGVYAWVNASVRAELRGFIARHLKPGGLVYVSYNAMPGWAAELPLQRLIFDAAKGVKGNSLERFDQAIRLVEGLNDAGALALRVTRVATPLWRRMRRSRANAYFPHEYLPQTWQPMYVSDVRRDMREIGLAPVGSASLITNFDSFVLRARAREALAAIADPELRELARDYFLRTAFRRDIYSDAPAPISEATQRQRLLGTSFDLSRPAPLISYQTMTPAGKLRYDNPFTRAIVAGLAKGPKTLEQLAARRSERPDVLASALTLCATGALVPVAAQPGAVGALNQTVLADLSQPGALTQLAHPHGTGGGIPQKLIRDLTRKRAPKGDQKLWRKYFKQRGMWD